MKQREWTESWSSVKPLRLPTQEVAGTLTAMAARNRTAGKVPLALVAKDVKALEVGVLRSLKEKELCSVAKAL